MSKPAVLIVGAGPVGLTLAIECQRHGVPFRIIDKNATFSSKSKALGIWSGTIECMAAIGVVDDFLQRSVPIHEVIFSDTGLTISRISIHEGVESLYPVPFVLPQNHTEDIFLSHLRRHGVEVEWSTELIDMKSGEEEVEATLRRGNGEVETLKAGWLVGCDGARSFVRHHLPVQYVGITETKGFLLADAKIDGELEENTALVNWGPDCVSAIFPIRKGVHRVFAQRPDTSNQQPPTLDEMQRHLDDNGLGRLKLRDAEWLSYFNVNERYSSRIRIGRVFLMGDAAHIHSPAGGQGMNTGIQDAYNLGWKLGLMARGCGDAELLAESFHQERHPIAQAVVEKSTKLLHAGMANNVFMRIANDIAVAFLFQSKFEQRKISSEFSELHICYEDSALVVPDTAWPNDKGFEPGSKPRDVELQKFATHEPVSLWRSYLDPRHTLVIFSGKYATHETLQEMAALVDEVKVYGRNVRVIGVWTGSESIHPPEELNLHIDPTGAAHDRYGLVEPGWYLVRPDQYLAARSATFETKTLHGYLRKVVGQTL